MDSEITQGKRCPRKVFTKTKFKHTKKKGGGDRERQTEKNKNNKHSGVDFRAPGN